MPTSPNVSTMSSETSTDIRQDVRLTTFAKATAVKDPDETTWADIR